MPRTWTHMPLRQGGYLLLVLRSALPLGPRFSEAQVRVSLSFVTPSNVQTDKIDLSKMVFIEQSVSKAGSR